MPVTDCSPLSIALRAWAIFSDVNSAGRRLCALARATALASLSLGELCRCEEFDEMHTMRYFFAPELSLSLQITGFDIVVLAEWMTGREPDRRTWNVVLQKTKKTRG
jgi:hypothetical protein